MSTAGTPSASARDLRVGGVVQLELGGDPGAVRAFGERTDQLGFAHLLAYDHVVGADPAVHTGWNGPYDVRTTFHEPLVMFGYLAALTSTLELVTGVIILPQRHLINIGLAVLLVVLLGLFIGGESKLVFWLIVLVSLALGGLLIVPIGGADMPVVISTLNAFTGLSAAAAGVALDNTALIVAGMLVGASGTNCRAG